MKRNYYFLASSLVELIQGKSRRVGLVSDFVDFCAEQLHPEDFESLRSLFLLNDVKNFVAYHAPEDPWSAPSYCSQEELAHGRAEPERLLPFLREHVENRADRVRLFPELIEVDELTTLFYQHLDDLADPLVRDYFTYELNLRNIAVALELRESDEPFRGKLIPFGEAYEQISRESSDDFGLTDSFPYIRKLIPLYREDDLTAREEFITETRWSWLDEQVGSDMFSSNHILSYALKLVSIARWESLNEEKGEELFGDLLNTVRRSVRFAIEFGNAEGRETVENRK